ncbi:uncharacterized protein BJ171DRAFT_511460 [Polychytrium aggregatum]|uniref:uncharacterized protein n=1 Tax=Polychytrium aggregatum TaxID=110093 RepID=UPI0022FF27FF|nr:uncharacterized protein BJ171DRAFT_511460 [Polychytrium aggregatum]KAI9202983.1 hypothetical protein BJ171DRAFT_511460 [Polychytrium aggregatum]
MASLIDLSDTPASGSSDRYSFPGSMSMTTPPNSNCPSPFLSSKPLTPIKLHPQSSQDTLVSRSVSSSSSSLPRIPAASPPSSNTLLDWSFEPITPTAAPPSKHIPSPFSQPGSAHKARSRLSQQPALASKPSSLSSLSSATIAAEPSHRPSLLDDLISPQSSHTAPYPPLSAEASELDRFLFIKNILAFQNSIKEQIRRCETAKQEHGKLRAENEILFKYVNNLAATTAKWEKDRAERVALERREEQEREDWD